MVPNMPRRIALVSLCVLALLACRSRNQQAKNQEAKNQQAKSQQPPSPQPPAPVLPEPASVTLVAVGDILMHADVKRAAQNAGGFEPLWAEMEPLFHHADLVFGNLETPVAPITGRPGRPFLFNAPVELPTALKHSGFTVLATANNHSYDQGRIGAVETLTRLEVEGLASVGSGRDTAQAELPRIIERHGIRIAFLAWADMLNIDLNREGKGPWINPLKEDKAVEAVRAARLQADAVVVSLHWGNEYQHHPTKRQRDLAAKLLEAGTDLILGHHPHVLQPLEVTMNGGRQVAVAFSLGNFISNQDRIYDSKRMSVASGDNRDGIGVMATFTRQVAPDGSSHVVLDKIGYEPLWTENNWREYRQGKTKNRDIHVIRLDAPDRQVPPWSLRRERIRSIIRGAPK